MEGGWGRGVKQGVLWRGVNSELRYHCRYVPSLSFALCLRECENKNMKTNEPKIEEK